MDNDRTVLVNLDNHMSLEEAYMELGKAYYEGGFEDPLPQLLPLFDKITRIRMQGESVEPAAGAAKTEDILPAEPLFHQESASFCQNCGAQLEPGAAFCGNCGSKVV